jgi:hypothetical protein
MPFSQESINQYGILGAALGALFTVFLYKGIPAFFNYLGKLAEIRLKNEEVENQTQQVDNKKDLALIRAQQVLEDEYTELRETKRLQAAQILEQATEISRLKNFETAVDEYRNQRALLLAWIEEQSGHYLSKDNLVIQMKNEIQILETMLKTPYTDEDA